jgi:NAD(P)-dependent dehydrogenase (short-subunit alcohol dehydrogenase family)
MDDHTPTPARFTGRVAVVTGSATGIGEAIALRFAAEGARVACLDNNTAENRATAAAIAARGGTALALECDVRSADSQRDAFASVVDRWQRIDILVACAGIFVGSAITDIPLERWRDIEATNLSGVLISNQLAAPHLIARGAGSIINIASMAAKTSWPNSAEYSATKTGVIGITRSVAMDLGPHGITVNAVCPGNTLTAMVHTVAGEVGATLGMTADQWLAMRAEDTALKRLAEPWEIAGVVSFLASDDARYLTGQSIEVDGGLILS